MSQIDDEETADEIIQETRRIKEELASQRIHRNVVRLS